MTRVLLNYRAGRRGARIRRRLDRWLRSARLEVEVDAVEPSRLGPEVARLVRLGDSTVAVAGGDGSLRGAADHIAGSNAALLPIPAGTMNHFARRLGHHTPEIALGALTSSRIRLAPVGIVDDHVFLNTAIFGHYATVIRRRDRWRRCLTKWPAAALAFAVTMAGMREMEFVVEVDGRPLRKSAPLLWIGVGRGAFPLVHQSRDPVGPTELEIVVPRPHGRLASVAALLHLGRSLLVDRHSQVYRDVEVVRARTILVLSPPRLDVTLDGEVLRIEAPAFVGVEDECLRVLLARFPD